jgi:hypothetical protein
MPMREEASMFFLQQTEYLTNLAKAGDPNLYTKTTIQDEGPSKFDVLLEEYKIHEAFE